MKDTQMEAGLYCNSCKEELPHHVYYINGKIVRVECQECRRTMVFKVDVLKEFYKEVYKRVFTKPNRVSKEYRKDINRFLTGIPIRLVSKPYRLMKDFNESMHTIHRYKKRTARK
ncbi:hypothetical protein [Priestia megaterium]|uniref:Bh protein n=1 Tax=Priestia megaterium TaxID=1404 RepID=A0ABD4X073_PRIMG|nr:hypothetical protein [Priestia megaterium]KRF56614.1 bh protein [Bacillus sp. Soil531]MCF6797103.1 bh protein [Bacillus sp. ET1]MDD9785541.1 bh protein [Priestia megaterium]MDN4863273.1 bh protein [Priestia megaterium]MED3813941.1 bh protein [Priestia megaterium]